MLRFDFKDRYPNATVAFQELKHLIKDRQYNPESQNPTTILTKLDPDDSPRQEFINTCQQVLAEQIGPFASMIVKKVTRRYPTLGERDLVKAISSNLDNHQQATTFEKAILAFK